MLRSSLGVVMSTGFLCFGLAAGSASAADAGLYYPAGPPAIDSPFYAPTIVQSHVDLYGGAAFFNFNGNTQTAGLFGGAGRANAPFQNGWNLQLDAQGNTLIFQEDGPVSFSEFGGYAHLYKRDPNSHAVGVFVGADYPLFTSVYTVGVEGQMYWPQFTLYGQASVASVSLGSSSGHALQLRGEGQWYMTDDTALIGDVIWTGVNLDSVTVNTLTLAGSVMHRFSGTPWAGFVKGRWDQSTSGGDTASTATVLVGVRLQADPPGSTLKSHRRTGPAMDVEPIMFGGAFIGEFGGPF